MHATLSKRRTNLQVDFTHCHWGRMGASNGPSQLPYRAVSSDSLCFAFLIHNLPIWVIKLMVMISLSECLILQSQMSRNVRHSFV